jgi:hypothetical protein
MQARMYHVTGRRDLILHVWEDTYLNSPSKEARGVAERSLKRLKAPLPVRKQKRSTF